MSDRDDPRTCPVLILAGGRAERFGGIDKAFVEHAGQSLLRHALTATNGFAPIWVASSRSHERYRKHGMQPLADPVQGFAGPLSGLLAGFSKRQQGPLISIPVDLLGPRSDDLRQLEAALRHGECACAYALTVSRRQPLLAAWWVDQALIDLATSKLQAGHGSVFRLQDEIASQTVDFTEPSRRWLNLNSPADSANFDSKKCIGRD